MPLFFIDGDGQFAYQVDVCPPDTQARHEDGGGLACRRIVGREEGAVTCVGREEGLKGEEGVEPLLAAGEDQLITCEDGKGGMVG